MKKLIILICIGLYFSSCNFGEINIVGHKKQRNKLPDLIISIENFILHSNAIELFLHIQNLGGFKFSQAETVIITYINNGVEKELININNLDTNNFFHITQAIPLRFQLKSIYTTIDKPIIDGKVSRIGFIKESNEDNNTSNTLLF